MPTLCAARACPVGGGGGHAADDAAPGVVTMGVIVAVGAYGCVVRFFNGLSALVPVRETGCVLCTETSLRASGGLLWI